MSEASSTARAPPAAARTQLALRSAGGLSKEDASRLLGDGVLRVDRGGPCVGAHRCRSFANALEPAPQVRELLEALTLRLIRHDPRIAGDIGDRVVPRQVAAIAQTLMEHAIEPIGLLHVAIDGVRNLLRRVTSEVVVLSGHRTQARHLPEEPLRHLDLAAHIPRQKLAAFLGEVQKNRTRLENRQRLAAIGWRVIDDRWDAIVRRDLEERRLKLGTTSYIHGNDAVGEGSFLQEHRDLVTVR